MSQCNHMDRRTLLCFTDPGGDERHCPEGVRLPTRGQADAGHSCKGQGCRHQGRCHPQATHGALIERPPRHAAHGRYFQPAEMLCIQIWPSKMCATDTALTPVCLCPRQPGTGTARCCSATVCNSGSTDDPPMFPAVLNPIDIGPLQHCPGVPVSRLLLQQQQQQLEAKDIAALQAATINLMKLFGCMMLQYGLFQVSYLLVSQ